MDRKKSSKQVKVDPAHLSDAFVQNFGESLESITRKCRKLFASQYRKINKWALFVFLDVLLYLKVSSATYLSGAITLGNHRVGYHKILSKTVRLQKYFREGALLVSLKVSVFKKLCLTMVSRFSSIFCLIVPEKF